VNHSLRGHKLDGTNVGGAASLLVGKQRPAAFGSLISFSLEPPAPFGFGHLRAETQELSIFGQSLQSQTPHLCWQFSFFLMYDFRLDLGEEVVSYFIEFSL